MSENHSGNPEEQLFRSAEWYDRTINWEARLGREIPVLCEVFGLPGEGGVIDAGCGTGRQACAMAERGYRMIGADVSDEMLAVAGRHGGRCSADVCFVASAFSDIAEKVGDGHDGAYVIGNGLAVAESQREIRDSLRGLSRCLRVGGRLFLQILNFAPMRREHPCVRGPRVVTVEGVEYVSTRQYYFGQQVVNITNTTLWKDDGWRRRSWGGRLYPIELGMLTSLLDDAGLHVLYTWGSYAKEPFDIERSQDLIVVAEAGGRR